MSVSWTFPYFSGAANFTRLFDWQISPVDFDLASKLSPRGYLQYIHVRSSLTTSYVLNSYGYVLIILVSRFLFSGLGDIQGVIYLQVLVHVGLCLIFVTFIFADYKSRLLFSLLYAANPVVIYFVTFPFYYFWLCIPSICLAVLLIKPKWSSWVVAGSTPVLLLSLLIRPTPIFLSLLFYAFAFRLVRQHLRTIYLPCLSVFVAGIILFSAVNPRQAPWHTMYVGLGAYANHVGVRTLSDDEGYSYYFSKTGQRISTDPVAGNWGKPVLMKSYAAVVGLRYLEIAAAHPALLVRNAIVNFGQVFSVGYLDQRPLLSLLSSAVGWCIVVFLLIRKQFVWVLAVASSALSFFWYFPPIPAYNYAAYLLLVCGVISALSPQRCVSDLKC